MTNRIERAARNNALWCHAVCCSHGLTGSLDDAAWFSPTRTPPYYPDAVTLVETTDETQVLRRIDSSSGASVKDCWARLDLSGQGFAPLITGHWVWRAPGHAVATPQAGDGRTWRETQSPAEMEQWSNAWAKDPGDAAVLSPQLLEDEGVHVLAAQEGNNDFAAGFIVNVTGEDAGLTNQFSSDRDDARTWRGAASAAATIAPGLALVAWEWGDGVEAARAAGFEVIGPLTVWIA